MISFFCENGNVPYVIETQASDVIWVNELSFKSNSTTLIAKELIEAQKILNKPTFEVK